MTLLFARTDLHLGNPSICTSRICIRINYMSLSLSLSLSVCLFVCVSVCLFGCVCPVCLCPVCLVLSVCCFSVCLFSVCVSVFLSVSPVCLSCLFVCQYIYFHTSALLQSKCPNTSPKPTMGLTTKPNYL